MKPIVQTKKVSKIFTGGKEPFSALKKIDLTIYPGEIYGIIGMSGAGKSTLIRCLNYLEIPTEGEVFIEGIALSALKEKELLEVRKGIGMIFQHFNLLMQKNVLENVCFPLRIAGVNKKEAREKAEELLKLVGLEDKKKAYPTQLSGGQKQRVAIARALMNQPKILLCDEATSALDPSTTKSILNLLKEINSEYGITIIMITHEMSVVKDICTHVALLDHGKLKENGRTEDILHSSNSELIDKFTINNTEEERAWSKREVCFE